MGQATAMRLGLHHTGSSTFRSASQMGVEGTVEIDVDRASDLICHSSPTIKECSMQTKKAGKVNSPRRLQ